MTTNQFQVQIICDSGKTWVTLVSGSFNEVKNYFLGQTFTDLDFSTSEETNHTCVDVKVFS